MTRVRLLLGLLVALAAIPLAACGGGGAKPASAPSGGADVDALLKETFANSSRMRSATMDLKLNVDPSGSAASAGSVAAQLSGPFVSQGAGDLPQFALAAKLTSGGKVFNAGLTWTGRKGFVALAGTDYRLGADAARRLRQGFARSARSGQPKNGGPALSSLGVDPSKWLRNARNGGTAKVGGVDTIRITGDADVARVIEDLETIAKKASALNLPGASGSVPTQLTPAQKQQAVRGVKALGVTVYTGAQDKLLRRLVLNAKIDDAASGSAAKVGLDLTFTEVGEVQAIREPASPKPFSELRRTLDSLGALGLAASARSGSSVMRNNVDRYAKCIEQAQGDTTKARKCADLLTG